MLKNCMEVLKLIENAGFKAYIVGGFVRDYILKRKSTDIDICTDALPKDLVNIFDAKLPNNAYGSVIVNYKGYKYEVTTFRKEIKYENRKPILIEYSNELEVDLCRRDFTINAICMDSSGNIIDLYGGKNDIKNKVINCIGDACIKFSEDPLRILRAIRFAVLFNFKLSDEVINAININASLLRNISYDRKKEELSKMFVCSNIKYCIELLNMFNLNIYLDLGDISNVKFCSDVLGIWCQLDISKYNFSNIEKDIIFDVKKIINNKTIGKYEIYKYGLYKSSIAAEILGISKKVVVKIDNRLVIRCFNDVDISSEDIISLFNRKPGKWLKEICDDLEYQILYSKVKNKKENIVEYILKKY